MKQAIQIEFRGKSKTVALPPVGELLTVGSKAGCQIVLEDPAIDAIHLEVEVIPAGVRVRDCATRNGTRVNGALMSQAILSKGDEVALGGARIRLAPIETGKTRPSPGPSATRPVPVSAPRAAPRSAPRPIPKPAPGPACPPAELPSPAPKAGVRERSRHSRRSPLLLVFVALVVVAGAAAVLLFTGESNADRAEAAYKRAVATRANGDREVARKEFLAVARSYPTEPAAQRARKAANEIDAAIEREKAATAARKSLAKQWKTLTEAEFESEWNAFLKKYAGTPASNAPNFLDHVRQEYRKEARRHFDSTKDRANSLADEGRWYDAALVWHEYLTLPSNVPPDEKGATEEFRKLTEREGAAFAKVAGDAKKLMKDGKLAEATALLTSHVEEFRNTRYAFDIRQRLELIDVLKAASRPGRTAAVPSKAAKAELAQREVYLHRSEGAEALVRKRRYSEAVAAFEKLAKHCPFSDLSKEFSGRADDLRGYAKLFTELRSEIREHPEWFRGLDLGNGFKANATAADPESLTVSIRSSRVELPWSRISSPRLLDLLLRTRLEPPVRLALARFAFAAGDEVAGDRAITSALKADPKLRSRAFRVLARARKIAVPKGGFVLYKQRWMTPAERDAAALRDRIADAKHLAESSNPRRRDEGLKKLRAIGGAAKPALVKALDFQLEAASASLTSLPSLKDAATKARLYAELQQRRKAALALIFDTKKYPYPHSNGPAYAKVQAQVVALVDKVRQVWENPISLVSKRNQAVGDLLSLVDKYDAELGELGSEPDPTKEQILSRANAKIAIQRYAPGGKAKSRLKWDDKVLEFNKLVVIDANKEERACVDALNAYRIMMGRRAVMWNADLLACARGHSKEMKDLHYFAHRCPFPGPKHDAHRNPSDRARQAGYGGPVSENIALGSTTGKGAFLQWFGSSGHHRNMLGKNHTEVGVGEDANYWTQNFGSVKKTVELPKKSVRKQ